MGGPPRLRGPAKLERGWTRVRDKELSDASCDEQTERTARRWRYGTSRIERKHRVSMNQLPRAACLRRTAPRLIERDLGGELGTRVRGCSGGNSQKNVITCGDEGAYAYWAWLIVVVTAFLASYISWCRGSTSARSARPARPVVSRGDATRRTTPFPPTGSTWLAYAGVATRRRSGRCSASSATTPARVSFCSMAGVAHAGRNFRIDGVERDTKSTHRSRRMWKARTRMSSTRGAT